MKRSSRLLSAVPLTASASLAAMSLFVLAASSGAQANDLCTTSGTEQTCTGDQSGGVSAAQPITNLVIKDLTANIAPASGQGVFFQSNSTVDIDSNTGTYSINSVGDGIFAESLGDTPDATVSVTQTGNIVSSEGKGIYAYSARETVDVDVTGNITSKEDGVFAQSTGDTDISDVSVLQSGDISSSNGRGIYASSARQSVSVISGGAIISAGDGVFAESTGDAETATVTVMRTGDITSSGGRGIYANSARQATEVVSLGDISAYGDGIFAQSTGDASTATVSVMQTGDVTSTTGYGIYANSARQTVSVNVIGDISSANDAIFAQSTGNADTATVTVIHDGSIVSTAGRGIYALSSNQTVSVANIGSITAASDGIFAVSTGNAATATVNVNQNGAITSSTGYGIYARSANQTVTVNATGDIASANDAIFAQSTGNAETATVSVTHSGAITSVNGRGINAQSSNQTVSVLNTGNIAAGSDGIYAVSTGNAATATVSVTQTGAVTSGTGYGIYARSSNQTVTVNANGAISSAMDGIFAQSTGNASTATVSVTHTGAITSTAGRGIYASASNQAVGVNNSGNISAYGDGIFAQSLGDSGLADVAVTQTGDVTSTNGYGIYALSSRQSVQVDVTGDITSAQDGIFAQSTGDSSDATVYVGQLGNINAGGRGIYASSARQGVSVSGEGDITSVGDGIFAQSTGDSEASDVSVFHDGDIDSQGRGIFASASRQSVSVLSYGDITASSDGIFAQTTGDAAEATVTVNSYGAIDAGSRGIYASASRQAVSVFSVGDITATDYGIFASTTGDSLTATANVVHYGAVTMQPGGTGLYAYSSGREAAISSIGNVSGGNYGIHAISESTTASVEILGGVISGASVAQVSAASILGASVTNYDEIDGGSSTAIELSGAENIVRNYGTVSGNINAGTLGFTGFENKYGALFNSGNTVDLGGGTLFNDGTLGIGQVPGVISTTALTGSFTQSDSGVIKLDLSLQNSGSSDLITVTDGADLNGKVDLEFTDFNGTLPSTYTIIKTEDGLNSKNLSIANVVVQGGFNYVNDNKDVELVLTGLDFATGAQSKNDKHVGQALTSAFDAVSPGLSELFGALVDFTDEQAYGKALSQLTPELYADTNDVVVANNRRFANDLMSCKTYTGGASVNAEGQCGWFAAEGFTLDYDPSNHNASYNQDGFLLGAGFQKAVSEDWRMGLGVSYARTTMDGAHNSQSDNDQLAIGAVVKYDKGPLLLAADVTAGYVWTDLSRRVNFEGFSDKLSADTTGAYVGGRLRAAYTQSFGHAYLQPRVDVDMTYFSADDYSEKGGEAALDVDSQSQFTVLITPALELGGDFVGTNGMNYRPYARAGVIFNTDPNNNLDASFANANAGSGSFQITSETDAVLGSLALGFDVVTEGNSFGRLVYEGQLGENTTSQSLTLKVGVPF
ncbi:autotransporter domain-containing protein [Aestuariivirga sp.]|uniref:autotransporter domain-containing protein n=1 Tax=Aestuariivirga sp. TaxID=2650926 RepID=UPI003BAA0BA6